MTFSILVQDDDTGALGAAAANGLALRRRLGPARPMGRGPVGQPGRGTFGLLG